METAKILQADMLDVIFDNRNKDYGAYALRKYYHKRLYKALSVILFAISILSAYILFHKGEVVADPPFVFDVTPGSLTKNPKKEEINPPTPKPKQPIQNQVRSRVLTPNIKLVDSTDLSVKPIKNLDSFVISTVDVEGTGNNKQIVNAVVSTGTGAGKGNDSSGAVVKDIDKTAPLKSAEFMPSYPGGEEALLKFLRKNLQNPQDLDPDQTVSVRIKFVVGYDGVLKGFEIAEDGGRAFNNEVIRVLKKMPAWIPGKTAGENVSVYYSIPVKFTAQE